MPAHVREYAWVRLLLRVEALPFGPLGSSCGVAWNWPGPLQAHGYAQVSAFSLARPRGLHGAAGRLSLLAAAGDFAGLCSVRTASEGEAGHMACHVRKCRVTLATTCLHIACCIWEVPFLARAVRLSV